MTAALDEILAWLDEKPTLSRTIGAARRIDQLQSELGLLSAVSVLIVRNFTIEPIEPLLKVAASRVGLHLTVSYSGYDPGDEDELGALLADVGADVVFVALRLEELAPALTSDFLTTGSALAAELADDIVDRVVGLASAVRARSRATVLLHNFAMPLHAAGGLADAQDPDGQFNMVRRANIRLAEQIDDLEGAHLLDLDQVFGQLGLAQCYDERGHRNGDAPLSQAALRALADSQARHIRALRGPVAKCLVLDCDNTLWGGVVGEDGIAGLALGETGDGRRYRDFQQSILNLRRRGVVLAICSKNEEADVLDVLRKHPDCLLGEDDFAAKRINWDDKASNIASIAAELDLGLQHFVFIDDNPVECEWVKGQLPEVRVLQFPGDLDAHGGEIDNLGLFDSLVVTEEDRSRTQMYRAEAQRRTARAEVADVDDYLRSLKMEAIVGSAQPEHLARLAQLTQRTNQFNLTTRRYDVSSLGELVEAGDTAAVLWLELRDRFGSAGVVGCGIVRAAGEVATIDTFLMSCRVLGRHVESVMANQLARAARDMGATVLIGEFRPSERNAQVADLYTRLGFEGPEVGAEGSSWRWDLAGGDPPVPDWFEIINADLRQEQPNE